MSHAKTGFFLASALFAVLMSAPAQSQTWTQDGPAPRYHGSAVYDISTDQMIAFGGEQGSTVPLNDVWSVPGIIAAGQTSHYHAVQVRAGVSLGNRALGAFRTWRRL